MKSPPSPTSFVRIVSVPSPFDSTKRKFINFFDLKGYKDSIDYFYRKYCPFTRYIQSFSTYIADKSTRCLEDYEKTVIVHSPISSDKKERLVTFIDEATYHSDLATLLIDRDIYLSKFKRDLHLEFGDIWPEVELAFMWNEVLQKLSIKDMYVGIDYPQLYCIFVRAIPVNLYLKKWLKIVWFKLKQ